MNLIPQVEGSPSKPASAKTLRLVDWAFLGLFLVTLLLVVLQTGFGVALRGKPGWPEAALLLTAAATTIMSWSRRLPAQNVFLATAVIALLGSIIQVISIKTGIPFGPILYFHPGPLLFDTLPWFAPFIWVIVVLNSRGTARLILRPWRKTRTYGWKMVALTTVLALVFEAALEPFAFRLKKYWLWSSTRLPVDWYGTPLTNFAGWLLTVVLVLAFATPALINKKRTRKAPPNFHSLVVWTSLLLLFLTGAIVQQFWIATAVIIAADIAVAFFAIRGALW